MKINILGADYSIMLCHNSDDPRMNAADGFCDDTAREICVESFAGEDGKPNTKSRLDIQRKKILRHEIVHAFAFESGLAENSEWAQNEEMVDWIAMQGAETDPGLEGSGGVMTKEAALNQWFNGFDIKFYPSTAVPNDVVFPYGTYEVATSSWDGEPVGLTVNLWYFTTQEVPPNAKARELSEAIGRGGVTIPCDGGYIWLTRGSPWCQSLSDETDPNIKRRYINVTAEYLTEN